MIQSEKAQATKQMVEHVAQIPLKEGVMKEIGKVTNQIIHQISLQLLMEHFSQNQRLLENYMLLEIKANILFRN